VASPDEATQVNQLRTVFQRLWDFDLLLNISKCAFGQSQVEFLGHLITEKGQSLL
jgi:hypothetical protein